MRVALDTNVWSYLAASGEVAEFDARAAAAGLRIVTPPSVLLEVLYTRDSARRMAIVDALCSGRRVRPPSEAQTMCEEVVAEIRRLHPEWLRRMPDTAEVASLNSFWTKRIWREARDRARAVRVDDVERHHQEIITRNQRTNASRAMDQALDIRDLNALMVKPEDGDEFFAMWLYDVETNAMLRNWVSWAIVWAQMQRRVEQSGAVDAQHSSYLCDCDIFLTADKRFAHALNMVADQSPAPVATTRLVSGGSHDIVESIFDALL